MKFSKIALAAALVAGFAGAASAQVVDLDKLINDGSALSATADNSVSSEVPVSTVCAFTAGSPAFSGGQTVTKTSTGQIVAWGASASSIGSISTVGFSKVGVKPLVTTTGTTAFGTGDILTYATVKVGGADVTAKTGAAGADATALEFALASANNDVSVSRVAANAPGGFKVIAKPVAKFTVSCVN